MRISKSYVRSRSILTSSNYPTDSSCRSRSNNNRSVSSNSIRTSRSALIRNTYKVVNKSPCCASRSINISSRTCRDIYSRVCSAINIVCNCNRYILRISKSNNRSSSVLANSCASAYCRCRCRINSY